MQITWTDGTPDFDDALLVYIRDGGEFGAIVVNSRLGYHLNLKDSSDGLRSV